MNVTTEKIADFCESLVFEDLPDEVVGRTKNLILDTIGIIIRARHESESTESLISAIRRLGMNQGACNVFGDSACYSPSAAALINGTLAHSLDFDDTHAEASLHASAPILPAVLAAAQLKKASGKEILTAIALGYEIHIRLGKAIDAGDHYRRGFHPTATCGIFAAAAAAGKVLDLSRDQYISAFGIALSQTAGAMQFLIDGSWTKRLHVGQAAQNGLIASVMAGDNFKGPANSLEGKWGFFRNYATNADDEKATDKLGERWDTMALGVKPYPSCRYSHAAIDAIIEMAEKNALSLSADLRIEVGLPKRGFGVIGEPLSLKQHPKSIVDAQFSMPFSAAVAFKEKRFIWDDYNRHLSNHETLALCKQVSVVIDDLAEAHSPENMSANVRIRTGSKSYKSFVKVPKGEPTNFMSEDDFKRKFRGLCEPFMSRPRIESLIENILGIDQFGDASERLFAL